MEALMKVWRIVVDGRNAAPDDICLVYFDSNSCWPVSAIKVDHADLVGSSIAAINYKPPSSRCSVDPYARSSPLIYPLTVKIYMSTPIHC